MKDLFLFTCLCVKINIDVIWLQNLHVFIIIFRKWYICSLTWKYSDVSWLNRICGDGDWFFWSLALEDDESQHTALRKGAMDNFWSLGIYMHKIVIRKYSFIISIHFILWKTHMKNGHIHWCLYSKLMKEVDEEL